MLLAWCWIMHVYVIPQLLWSQCGLHQFSCISCKPWVQTLLLVNRITLGRVHLPKAQEKRMLRTDLGLGYLRNSSALFLLEWNIHQRRENMLSWCHQLVLRDLTSLSCSSIKVRQIWSNTPGIWMSLRLPVIVELVFFSAEFLGSQDVANAEFLDGLRIMLFLFVCFCSWFLYVLSWNIITNYKYLTGNSK